MLEDAWLVGSVQKTIKLFFELWPTTTQITLPEYNIIDQRVNDKSSLLKAISKFNFMPNDLKIQVKKH